jgi:hypothetical protein
MPANTSEGHLNGCNAETNLNINVGYIKINQSQTNSYSIELESVIWKQFQRINSNA